MPSQDADFGELLEQVITKKRMHYFESESGVRNLRTLAEILGYRRGLEEMLADNPFLQQAIVDALMNYRDDLGEWTEKLQEELLPEEE